MQSFQQAGVGGRSNGRGAVLSGDRARPGRRAGALLLAAAALILAGVRLAGGSGGDAAGVDFRRDIRPLLSDLCFTCHGPDEKKRRADLRLDTREGAFEDRDGGAAIIPAKPLESKIFQRITAEDPRDRMPPRKTGKNLSDQQIELIRRWIEEGAEWKDHWSYVPPRRPPVPEPQPLPAPPPAAGDFVKNIVDRFVLARLQAEGLHPAPEADRITLIRRLSFDLQGLPPSPQEVREFADDARPDAYERLVDRLLASPHYGERMAMYWLDVVRYADTTGYHGDNHRDIWGYRDYVIRAFNDNMPFDRFTTEQLAGDLLPGSTAEQKVASGYNRLNMTTQEGGAQAGEYVAKYSADRVRNASSAWLGATMGCAECHDHKYDPYTARDFYSFAAFFADVQEMPIGEPGPGFPMPSADQAAELDRLDRAIADLKAKLDAPHPELAGGRRAWEESLRRSASEGPRLGEWRSVGPFPAASFDAAYDSAFEPEKDADAARAYEGGKIAWTPRPEWTDGAIHALSGENSATYLARVVEARAPGRVEVSLGSDDAVKAWLDGKEVLARKVTRPAAPDQEKVALDLAAGSHLILVKIVNAGGDAGFYFRLADASVPHDILAIIGVSEEARSPEQNARVADHYRSISPELGRLREELAAREKDREELVKRLPTTMITVSVQPRTVRILPRGNWLDESGDVVEPALPHFFPRIEKQGRADRLDLARWLVSKDNPLTARVFVNRLWKLFFGQGLAKNLDDLGSQGAPPTHPELLDWLAVEFVESGWDVKGIVRLLVLSGAYRQESRADRHLRERDPYNTLCARQGRWRLDAEMVRDAALKVGGLLSPRVGGPSVKPPQPPGYWQHLNFPKREWAQDHGEDAHRRGLYTYWQRTFLYPSLLAFDAPAREDGCPQRNRSSTPIQALVLLNDPVYVEAARAFAERILREGGAEVGARIDWAWREAVSRGPSEAERKVVEGLLERHRARYALEPEEAKRLVTVGEKGVPADLDLTELAAWTAASRTILNLQETTARN